MSFLSQYGSMTVTTPHAPGPTDLPTVDGAVIVDSGSYNAFFHPLDQNPGEPRIVFWKDAGGHGIPGFMPMGLCTDGENYVKTNVKINGVTITDCAALTSGRTQTGRILIGTQDGLAQSCIIAGNDNIDENFTLLATIPAPTGYSINFNTDKIRVTEEGNLLLGVYLWPSNPTDPHKGWLYKAGPNGDDWTFFAEVFSGTNDNPTGDANTWRCSEFSIEQTHYTGVDATGKWICVIRVNVASEGGTYYLFKHSPDGCATWDNDTTEDAGSFVDDNGVTQGGPFTRRVVWTFLVSNSPVRLRYFGGNMAMINGERNTTNGWKLKISWATPDGAYQNHWDDWSRPFTILTFNANTLGQSIDCGYPADWVDWQGRFFCDYYDEIVTDDRCFGAQVELFIP